MKTQAQIYMDYQNACSQAGSLEHYDNPTQRRRSTTASLWMLAQMS